MGLAAASDAGIRVIDLSTARVLRTLEGHTCNVFGLASRGRWHFSGGGNGMLSEADLYGEPYENSLRAWDASTGAQVWSHDTGRAVALRLAPSADGRRLIAGLSDGSVRVVDLPPVLGS